MILTVHAQVHDFVVDAIRRRFGMPEVPPFGIEVPPNRALGDLAVPVAFQLARTLKKPPRVIAQEIVDELGILPGVTRVLAAPNGYLNVYLDRPAFLLARLKGDVAPVLAPAEKTIVEHTAINPNKAAHVGHLRNAALGDTLVRVLRFRGTPVEVQNYIDDTGVQVADVVVGFSEIEQRTLADVRRIAETTRFDHFCWDLYARVTGWYEADPDRLAIRAAVLRDIERGGNPAGDMAAFVADRIVRCHLATMARLNISYDLLTWEGDILRLHFWTRAFEVLKAEGAVRLQDQGRLAGCWVMRIDESGGVPDEEEASDAVDEAASDAREKVIVRSNGTVTYVGKDLAYQFWKLGLLGLDFRYRVILQQAGGRPLWSTTSGDGDPDAPRFGRATWIYNVIDSRQSYLQALLSQALRTLGHPQEADRSIHFSYEMVALTLATARELGYEIAAETPGDPADGAPAGTGDARKAVVEVSGRKGLGVKIDDLLDLLVAKASTEVAKRNPGIPADECSRIASVIAVAAIRYFMVKYSRGTLIAFDIEEALSFEGESGPYLQYAVVRANNIFHKLHEREGVTEGDLIEALDPASADELSSDSPEPGDHALWALVLEASRLDDIVEQVVRSLEFSVLAKYAFGLAQMFNGFYHKYPILNEERSDRKRWRAAGVAYFRAQLTRTLALMGIEVPSRM